MKQRAASGFGAALLVSSLLLACFQTVIADTAAASCGKKGVGIAGYGVPNPAQRLSDLHARWYYDWRPKPIRDATPVPFVPLVWVPAPEEISTLTGDGRWRLLLGFNEPDLAETAVSVATAVDDLRSLQGAATRLGSPAISTHGRPWLDAFMAQAKQAHLRVDFIAMHWYGPPDAKAFLDAVDSIHEAYGLPVWVTEFAVKDNAWRMHGGEIYSPQQVLAFMRSVLPELERRDYVERYAWFGVSSKQKPGIASSRFFDDSGQLTALGRYYAAFDQDARGNACGTP